jgi:hypothetical protein
MQAPVNRNTYEKTVTYTITSNTKPIDDIVL